MTFMFHSFLFKGRKLKWLFVLFFKSFLLSPCEWVLVVVHNQIISGTFWRKTFPINGHYQVIKCGLWWRSLSTHHPSLLFPFHSCTDVTNAITLKHPVTEEEVSFIHPRMACNKRRRKVLLAESKLVTCGGAFIFALLEEYLLVARRRTLQATR